MSQISRFIRTASRRTARPRRYLRDPDLDFRRDEIGARAFPDIFRPPRHRARGLAPFYAFITVLVMQCGWITWSAAAEPNVCAAGPTEQTLTESFGSVALMANLRNSAGSVSAVAEELLGRALDPNTWPGSACPDGCELAGREVVYKVLPTVYIEKDRQRPECLRLESETSEQPLRFGSQRFATLEEMTTWIMRFSRGKGEDGKALYRECSSNCSPRYTFLIRNGDGGGFVLEPEVVCGLARDKDSTRYSLSTSLRTSCGSPPQAVDAGS